MWIFNTPESYSDIIRKISTTMFCVVLIGLLILSHISLEFCNVMKLISFGFEYEWSGIKLFISYLYIPLIFSILENIFKLHDKISDLLGIRYRYDKNVIINKYFEELNISYKLEKVNKKNRDKIMSNIFYKYAGYSNPIIDKHFISMALGCWNWYWIILDTLLVVLTVGLLTIILSFTLVSLIVLFTIIILLILFLVVLKNTECRKYSIQEVEAILSDRKRKDEVRRYLKNAL